MQACSHVLKRENEVLEQVTPLVRIMSRPERWDVFPPPIVVAPMVLWASVVVVLS